MDHPGDDAEHMELLQYYKDRVDNLESRLHYLDQILSEVSFQSSPEVRDLLKPSNFAKINDLVEQMLHTPEKSEIFQLIVEGIHNIFGFQRISLLEIQDGNLHVVENRGLPDDYVNNLVIPVEDQPGQDHRSVIGRSAARGETIVIKDRSDSVQYNQRDKQDGKTFSHQFLAIPVITFDDPIGVLTVAIKKNSDYYLNERTVEVLKFFVNQSAAALENQRQMNKRENNYQNTILTLVSAVEAKDKTTGDHARRLRHYSEELGSKIGLNDEQKRELKWGAILHDIGKIATEGRILQKEDELSPEEFAQIKEHPRRGYEILEHLNFIDGARDIVLYHHERWDGNGYPEGLSGEDIPLLARVLNLIDSYDVMIHERPYKDPMPEERAVAEVIDCAGGQFDPNLIDPFLDTLPEDVVNEGKKLVS